jgi:hypothetical protein
MKTKIFLLIIYLVSAYAAFTYGQNMPLILESIQEHQRANNYALNYQQTVINDLTRNLDVCQDRQFALAAEVKFYLGFCIFLGGLQVLQALSVSPENSLIHKLMDWLDKKLFP